MKAKTFVLFAMFGAIECAALDCAYRRGQVKGLRIARAIIEDCKNNFKSAEEKHD